MLFLNEDYGHMQKAWPAHEQFDQDKLHRTRIDGQARQKGPQHAVACLLQHQAERHADKHISEKNRRGRGRSRPQPPGKAV